MPGAALGDPIHAACVACDDDGILLVGDSRTGKSSLAWACARAGLAFVSDDCTWLLRRPLGAAAERDKTLVGKPQSLCFEAEAVELIPELAELPHLETVKGNGSFEVRTAHADGLPTASRCRPWKLAFLDRRPEGPARLAAVSPAGACRRLATTRPLFEERVWQEQQASIARLVEGGALELRYSTLASAVEQILQLA